MPRGLKQKYDNSTEQIKCNSRTEQKSSYKWLTVVLYALREGKTKLYVFYI